MIFDPIDVARIPEPARSFHMARQRWVSGRWESGRTGEAVARDFERATQAMVQEVARRNGRWDLGHLIYKLDSRNGIVIEQCPGHPGIVPDDGGSDRVRDVRGGAGRGQG